MPIGGGIALLVVGAILTFALTGSIRGLNLDVVGVILMLAGALALLLPWLVRARQRSNLGVARSRQDAVDDGTVVELPDNDLTLEDQRRVQNRRRLWVRRD